MTETQTSIRIAPISIKGRYFLFAQNPPTVMMVDAATAVVAQLLDQPQSDTSACREKYLGITGRRGVSEEVAGSQFDAAVTALRAAGLTRLTDITPGGNLNPG
ncbi:hypothetical protein [Streptosporangium sp. NPDC049644]|uniref:hypothetical protein n=1 Tax=Streptosporangium sp. NPDC049644 TaxID=3155507 RepID=UPI003446789D